MKLFGNNPMLIATENSFQNGMTISTFHDNALANETDPFFVSMYQAYHPFHVAYKTAFDKLALQGGMQRSKTISLYNLLILLSGTKIKQWDIKIQNQYAQNTAPYNAILPKRRKPFQTGTQENRIHAVKVLSDAIDGDATLAAVKTDIDSFYTQLEESHTGQKQTFNDVKNKSSELETARVAMATAQYANLGGLIQKFAGTPDKIFQYFDLKILNHARQINFTGHVKPGEAYTVVKHTFGAEDEVRLSNSGIAILKFYLSGVKDVQPGTTSVTLGPGEEIVLASSLGKLTDPYLTVSNTDASQTGAFEIEIL